jgi:hypothetical protein
MCLKANLCNLQALLLLPPLAPPALLLLLLLQLGMKPLTYDWGHMQWNGNIKRIDAPKSLQY